MSKKKKTHSIIKILNCQIKSLEKAKIVCKALDTLEKEIGIGRVEISFENNFICPDIDLSELSNSSDPMERLIGNLLITLNIKQYGHKSPYRNIPIEEDIFQKSQKQPLLDFCKLTEEINGIVPAIEIAKLAWRVDGEKNQKFSDFVLLPTSTKRYKFLQSQITNGDLKRCATVYIKHDYTIECYLGTESHSHVMQKVYNQVKIFHLLQNYGFIN